MPPWLGTGGRMKEERKGDRATAQEGPSDVHGRRERSLVRSEVAVWRTIDPRARSLE